MDYISLALHITRKLEFINIPISIQFNNEIMSRTFNRVLLRAPILNIDYSIHFVYVFTNRNTI